MERIVALLPNYDSIEQISQIRISKWFIFALMMLGYFFSNAGIIYDMINEPPSVGVERDMNGRRRIATVMAYRINGQYIVEGFLAAFFMILGALGVILLTKATKKSNSGIVRNGFLVIGALFFIFGYYMLVSFLKLKIPGYLSA